MAMPMESVVPDAIRPTAISGLVSFDLYRAVISIENLSFAQDLVIGRFFRRVTALVDQHSPLKVHHFDAVLINAPGADRNDSLGRPALGFALRQNLRFRVERVSGENGMRRLDFVPSQIGH